MSTMTPTSPPIPALNVGDRVRFAIPTSEAGRWWTVRAGDARYTVLTRQREFRAAGELLYTIIDRQRGVRGPCNLSGQGWDVEEPGGCEALLRALQHQDERHAILELDGGPLAYDEPAVEVSYRNNLPVRITDHQQDRN